MIVVEPLLQKDSLFRDFCFHLVSFGVVSIAIDRLCTVYRLMHMGTSAGNAIGRRSNQLQFVRVSISVPNIFK